MATDGFGARLRGLALALVNATLLLAALVLVQAVMLAVQVRGVVNDGRAELRAEIVELRGQLADTRAQLALRAPPTSTPGAIAPRAPVDPDLAAFASAADALMTRLETMDGTDEETLGRAFFAAFFRFVLGRMIAGG